VEQIQNSRTTSQLLSSLHDTSDRAAWGQFDARYRPIVQAVALRLGLNQEDAADVAQQTMLEFVRDYRLGKYDRTKGRLKSWISGIAHHRAIDLVRADRQERVRRGESAMVALPEQREIEGAWDLEERRVIWREAMRELRQSSKLGEVSIRAFELVVEHKFSPEAAAAECGIGVHSVYQAKSRITVKLREIVERLSAEYSQEP